MNDIHTLLADVSKDQPPCSITRDTAISAGRRARRNRSMSVAAGAVAVLAAVSVGVAVLPGRQPIAKPTDGFAASPPTSWAAGSPAEAPDQVAARLTTVVRAAAAQVRPNAQFLADPHFRAGVRAEALEILPPAPATGEDAARNWYEGDAVVVDGQGRGLVTVIFAASGAEYGAGTAPCKPYSTDGATCAPRTGPRGERLSVLTSTKRDGSLENGVTVHRGDGSIVSVTSTNYTGGPSPATPLRPAPVFTIDELVRLVTRPGMALTR